MADDRNDQAWRRVGEELNSLAEGFRGHRQRLESADSAERAEPELRDGLRTLTEACDRLATGVGNALRDPEIHGDAKRTAAALFEALSTSFDDLGRRIRER